MALQLGIAPRFWDLFSVVVNVFVCVQTNPKAINYNVEALEISRYSEEMYWSLGYCSVVEFHIDSNILANQCVGQSHEMYWIGLDRIRIRERERKNQSASERANRAVLHT